MLKWIMLAVAGVISLVVIIAKNNPTTPPNLSPAPSAQQTTTSQYVPYSVEGVAAAGDKQKLLFFHASWCPTCRAAEQEILQNVDQLPEDLIIFKTDYDREKALKQKYTITYQHTFVLIDNEGNELKQWNGGGLAEINRQLI